LKLYSVDLEKELRDCEKQYGIKIRMIQYSKMMYRLEFSKSSVLADNYIKVKSCGSGLLEIEDNYKEEINNISNIVLEVYKEKSEIHKLETKILKLYPKLETVKIDNWSNIYLKFKEHSKILEYTTEVNPKLITEIDLEEFYKIALKSLVEEEYISAAKEYFLRENLSEDISTFGNSLNYLEVKGNYNEEKASFYIAVEYLNKLLRSFDYRINDDLSDIFNKISELDDKIAEFVKPINEIIDMVNNCRNKYWKANLVDLTVSDVFTAKIRLNYKNRQVEYYDYVTVKESDDFKLEVEKVMRDIIYRNDGSFRVLEALEE